MSFFGLITTNNVAVPLRQMSVNAVLVDAVSQVMIEQEYFNSESVPIEAVFKFPLDEQGAVCGFSAFVDGVEIRGVVKEKEEAFREYDRAIARGDGAYLGEADKADIFSISVGNLPPSKGVTIRVTYLTRLAAEGEDLRFVLPLAVCPRYTPSAESMAPTDVAVDVPVATSRGEADYPITFGITLSMSSEVLSVTSPSHALAQDATNPARFTLASGAMSMARDLIVLVRTARPRDPHVSAELDGETGHGAAMVSLFPLFENISVPAELVFVVDRSGSMSGQKMESTKAALQIFLRSMTAGTKFNIVSFGSSSSCLFSGGSEDYTEATMAKAVKHVEAMSADMGGTEILSALETRVFAAPLFPEHARQVFLLTDGEVSNNDAVIAAVRKVAATTRVFAFGIGNGASRALVNGVARAGRGEAEFIAEGEAIAPKIMRQLKRAVQPSLRDVRVEWLAQGTVLAAEAAPWVPRPIFSGERFVSFAFFEPSTVLPDEVAISGTSPTGRLEAVLKVPFETARRGNIVHRMAAKERIRELEEGGPGAVAPYVRAPRSSRAVSKQQQQQQRPGLLSRIFGRRSTADASAAVADEDIERLATFMLTEDKIKARVIELGVRYSLATRYTSFVAVEYRENKVSSELMELRPVAVNAAELEHEEKSVTYLKKCKKSSSPFAGLSFSLGRKKSSAPAPSASPSLSVSSSSMLASPQRRSSSTAVVPQRLACDALDDMVYTSTNEAMFLCEDDCEVGEKISSWGASPPPPPPPSGGGGAVAPGGSAPPAPPKALDKSRDLSESRKDGKASKNKESKSSPAAAAVSASSRPSRPARPDALIMLQGFDGSWKLAPTLSSAMGVSHADLESLARSLGVPQDKDKDGSVQATAVAVAWLVKHYAALKDEWELLVEKARAWLAAKGFPNLDAAVVLHP